MMKQFIYSILTMILFAAGGVINFIVGGITGFLLLVLFFFVGKITMDQYAKALDNN